MLSNSKGGLYLSDKTEPKDKDFAVVIVSDTHINSTVGLCKPAINLDDGGTYRISPAQHWLWRTWLRFIDDVSILTKDYRVVVVFNGDIGEVDTKRRTTQLVTVNKATILRMVVETIEPLTDVADAIFVIRGTPAHAGKSSWLEEALARDLNICIKSSKDIYSHYQVKGNIGGVLFDIAHHGRMGQLRHTAKLYAIRLAQETMDKYNDKGHQPPDIVVRSHHHRRADSGLNWPCFGVFTPGWQAPTEYIYRISGENDSDDVGGDVYLCSKDAAKTINNYGIVFPKFVWHPLDYSLSKNRKIWEVVKI